MGNTTAYDGFVYVLVRIKSEDASALGAPLEDMDLVKAIASIPTETSVLTFPMDSLNQEEVEKLCPSAFQEIRSEARREGNVEGKLEERGDHECNHDDCYSSDCMSAARDATHGKQLFRQDNECVGGLTTQLTTEGIMVKLTDKCNALARAARFLLEWEDRYAQEQVDKILATDLPEDEIARRREQLTAQKADAFRTLTASLHHVLRMTETSDRRLEFYPSSYSKSDIDWVLWNVKPDGKGSAVESLVMNGGINWSSSSNTWSVNT